MPHTSCISKEKSSPAIAGATSRACRTALGRKQGQARELRDNRPVSFGIVHRRDVDAPFPVRMYIGGYGCIFSVLNRDHQSRFAVFNQANGHCSEIPRNHEIQHVWRSGSQEVPNALVHNGYAGQSLEMSADDDADSAKLVVPVGIWLTWFENMSVLARSACVMEAHGIG